MRAVRLPLKSTAAIVKAQDAVAADLLASREVRRRFARARADAGSGAQGGRATPTR